MQMAESPRIQSPRPEGRCSSGLQYKLLQRTLAACLASMAAVGLWAYCARAPRLPAVAEPTKTLWFMAIASDEDTAPCRGLSDCPRAVQRSLDMHEEYAAYGKVAVLSAKRLAPSLVPVLLYPGRRNAFIDWFEAQGGLAFQHRTSLLHRWQAAVADRNVSETVYMAESLYLRYDIPFIMQPVLQALTRRGLNVTAINSTHVLFTDMDVMFTKDFDPAGIPHTPVVAAGAEARRAGAEAQSKENPGVLYINVEGAGKWFPRMLQWADRQWRWRNPYTGHVMRYFDDTDIVTQLPDAYNFKPYWGDLKDEAAIVHFHGPKPNRCLPCYLDKGRSTQDCHCPHYDKLWQQAMAADGGAYYWHLLEAYRKYETMDS